MRTSFIIARIGNLSIVSRDFLQCGQGSRLRKKEIRALCSKQRQRHAQQQLQMGGGIVQRNAVFVLHFVYAIENGVAVGEQRRAGFLQGAAGGQIMIQRFAVLAAFFPIAGGKKADPFGNQIAAGFKTRQKQQQLELSDKASGGRAGCREITVLLI